MKKYLVEKRVGKWQLPDNGKGRSQWQDDANVTNQVNASHFGKPKHSLHHGLALENKTQRTLITDLNALDLRVCIQSCSKHG